MSRRGRHRLLDLVGRRLAPAGAYGFAATDRCMPARLAASAVGRGLLTPGKPHRNMQATPRYLDTTDGIL